MAKAKKAYKKGASHAEIKAQLVNFCLFGDGDGDALDAEHIADIRPATAPKAVRLSWDPVERIDVDAAWDALLKHA